MLEIVIWIVIINWVAPLLMWVYPLAMTLIWKDFVFEGFHGPFAKFRLANEDVEPWHVRFWKDWGGVGLYWFMCYKDRPSKADDDWVERTILHEGGHCIHWAILGLLFYVFYASHSAWIFITQKIKGKPYTKHAYLDNWSERLARKRAGQTVDIPPNQWMHGKDDLIPWW